MIYDARGNVAAQGRQPLRPTSRPRHGVVVHPDDDLWESIAAASREAMKSFRGDPQEIAGVGLCTIRCCKAFLRADGSLVEPVISWMDDRAYQPYVPADPAVTYATTTSGYLAHRLTGALQGRRRQQHPAAVADRHEHLAVERRPGALRAVPASRERCCSSCSSPAT